MRNFIKTIGIKTILDVIIICLYLSQNNGMGSLILILLTDMALFAIYYFFEYRPLSFVLKILRNESVCGQKEEQLKGISSKYPGFSDHIDAIDCYAHQMVRRNTVQILDKQTELTALQSQINPHFLYNTLDSIRGEALINKDYLAAHMIETLAAFFRYSISRKASQVRLREELKNVENYFRIQRYRFNNRFSLEIEIDKSDEFVYDCLVPKLILQPVVENAIYHGLADIQEGGIVTVEVTSTENDLIIVVQDNGVGMRLEELRKIKARIHEGKVDVSDEKNADQINTGIALPNIHRRIQLLYGEKYGVDIYSSFGMGTDIEIVVPIQLEEKSTVL